MTLDAARLLVNVLGAYAVMGAVFALFFLWTWVGRLDRAAANATWGFRVLVFPGVALFWPLFLVRLLGGASEPPGEWTAHRAAARRARARRRVEVLR